MLRDILSEDDPKVIASLAVISQADPDIVLLTDIDYDATRAALTAFADRLNRAGTRYPFQFAYRTNAGLPTDLDLDGDGYLGGAGDAQGYGDFPGDGGMAILSRIPIDIQASQDFSGTIWAELPWATLPQREDMPFPSAQAQTQQRLSSTGHWDIRVTPENGEPFSLLAHTATPPVFDGPEDMNGLRNRDELLFWQNYLASHAPDRFVIAGNFNLDPEDGDGLSAAMAAFLADPRVIDTRPQSTGGALAADTTHNGDPALDTAFWPDQSQGNLRVSYVLSSANWHVLGSGVFWPAPSDPLSSLLGEDGLAAGPHRLVWVDLQIAPLP